MEGKVTITNVSGNSQFKDKVLKIPSPCAIILYGHGAELGDFKGYADSLKDNELKIKYGTNVFIFRIFGKKGFFDFFKTFDYTKYQIKELHIFAHSFGAGLSFPYHEKETSNPEVKTQMTKYYNYGKSIFSYGEVVDMEPNLLTDHFFTLDCIMILPLVVLNFTIANNDAFVKIWGCNSGVDNWMYGHEESNIYYWRALNDQNTPKPSIAQMIANSFKVKTYGAKSGSHSEILYNGNWITSQQYHNKHKKWPPIKYPHRLHPDKGAYYEFIPQ